MAHPRANDGDAFPHDDPTRGIQYQLGPVLPADDSGDTPEHLGPTQLSQPLAQTVDANVIPPVDTAFGASSATIGHDVATPKSILHPRGGGTWSNDPCPESTMAWQSEGARSRPHTAPRLTNQVPQGWLRYSDLRSPRRPYSTDARGLVPTVTTTTITAPAEMTESRNSWLAWGAGHLARSGKRRSLRRRVRESGGEQHLSKQSGGLTGVRIRRQASTNMRRIDGRESNVLKARSCERVL